MTVNVYEQHFVAELVTNPMLAIPAISIVLIVAMIIAVIVVLADRWIAVPPSSL